MGLGSKRRGSVGLVARAAETASFYPPVLSSGILESRRRPSDENALTGLPVLASARPSCGWICVDQTQKASGKARLPLPLPRPLAGVWGLQPPRRSFRASGRSRDLCWVRGPRWWRSGGGGRDGREAARLPAWRGREGEAMALPSLSDTALFKGQPERNALHVNRAWPPFPFASFGTGGPWLHFQAPPGTPSESVAGAPSRKKPPPSLRPLGRGPPDA